VQSLYAKEKNASGDEESLCSDEPLCRQKSLRSKKILISHHKSGHIQLTG
jgi:hypothetical protein